MDFVLNSLYVVSFYYPSLNACLEVCVSEGTTVEIISFYFKVQNVYEKYRQKEKDTWFLESYTEVGNALKKDLNVYIQVFYFERGVYFMVHSNAIVLCPSVEGSQSIGSTAQL